MSAANEDQGWSALTSDPALVEALQSAGHEASRVEIRAEVERIAEISDEEQRARERAVLRNMRKRWSERFAAACATMMANEVRRHPAIRKRDLVLPDKDGGGQETFTPLGYGKGKRIDVVVTRPLVGLQLGISLKGLNFSDDAHGNHDKNLTGRLYELREEVSTVHDYLPRAVMAAVFFLPVAACFDKVGAPSSFAHVVSELGSRTGRLDPSMAAHAWRCDFSAVALYVPGDPSDLERGLQPGVVRFFPVALPGGGDNPPPARGLPRVETTLDARGVVENLFRRATEGTIAAVQLAPSTDATGSAEPEPFVPMDESLEADSDDFGEDDA